MKSTNAIVSGVYPIVAKSLDKNLSKYKQMITRFIEARSQELYDTAPCSRIYYGAEDADDFFKSLQIDVHEITKYIQQTYYYPIANFNPRAAKDELTITCMMIIRYFYTKKMQKELELASVYMAFSAKFYPSIHFASYPVVQPQEYRGIMNYVINNELTQKFDLKREGSVIGAIKSICNTWLEYDDKFSNSDDDDVVYLIQQLHNRIKSFMKNIAELYYKAYKNKDYLTYDSDNMNEDSFRIADSDSLKAERTVEKAMEYMGSKGVDYSICKMGSDSNVKTDEIKSIMETILSDNENLGEVKELCRIIVNEYFLNSKTKDVRDIDFISSSITPKPNTKNDNLIRQKQIIENWLDENSTAYRKRKSRDATKSSYYKSILTYFVIVIHKSAK